MVTQNSMLELAAKMLSSTDTAKTDNKANGSYEAFGDVLKNSMGKTVQKNDMVEKSRTRNDAETSGKPEDRQVRYNSYREALAAKKEARPVAAAVKEDSKAVEEKGETDEAGKTKKLQSSVQPQENPAVEKLAEILGINASDLMKLMGFLNIKPEDLADPSKSAQVVEKLSNLLGLNEDQKLTLARVVGSLCAESGGEAKETSPAETAAVDGETESKGVELKEAKPEITVARDPKEEFSQIMEKLRVRLDEIKNRLASGTPAEGDELSKKIEQLLTEENSGEAPAPQLKATASEEDTAKQSSPLTANHGDKAAVETKKADTDAKSEDNRGNGGKENASGDTAVKPAVSEAGADKAAEGFNPAINPQVQKGSPLQEVSKATRDVPVTKNEIINQVVEKAKVVLSGEKSEMLMDLKPESLGKLSLKVVTERGMVVAQFVAESQQVKQVLEANMQLLKDSLEKQGLAVQQFSVSVGQDNSRNTGREVWNRSNAKSGSRRVGETEPSGTGVAAANQDAMRRSAYSYNESSINLTA